MVLCRRCLGPVVRKMEMRLMEWNEVTTQYNVNLIVIAFRLIKGCKCAPKTGTFHVIVLKETLPHFFFYDSSALLSPFSWAPVLRWTALLLKKVCNVSF